jgi:hypothetical protein
MTKEKKMSKGYQVETAKGLADLAQNVKGTNYDPLAGVKEAKKEGFEHTNPARINMRPEEEIEVQKQTFKKGPKTQLERSGATPGGMFTKSTGGMF